MEFPELLSAILYTECSAQIEQEFPRLKALAQANGSNLGLLMTLNYFNQTKKSPTTEALREYVPSQPKMTEEHILPDLEQAADWRKAYPAGSFELAIDNAWKEANRNYVDTGYRAAVGIATGGSVSTPDMKGYQFKKRMEALYGEDEAAWDCAAFSQIWLQEYLAANPFVTHSSLPVLDEGEYVISESTVLDDEDNSHATYLTAINGADIKPEVMDWLWTDRFPLGTIVWLAGLPGAGKTTVMLDIAARITSGKPFPDGQPNTLGPRRVVIAMCEDSLSKTIVPRLVAAGADMERVTFLNRVVSDVEDRTMKLDTDLSHLRKMLEKFPDTALLILDPMTSYFGDININIDKEARSVTTPLKRLCEERGVSMIGVIHNNKQSDANAIQKVLGSSSVSGAARAIYGCSSDPDDKQKRYFTFVKGNSSGKTSGLEYTITEKLLDGGVKASLIAWGNATDDTAEDCIKREREARYERKEGKQISLAQSFLPFFLKGKGAQLSRAVYEAAEAEGISSGMIKAAIAKFYKKQVIHTKGKNGWTMLWTEEEHPPEGDVL